MFALDPQALDDAAARIGAAAASVSCLDVAGPFRAAGEALPGSATSDALRRTATAVDAATDCWTEHLLDLCETARLVARHSVATDLEVAGTFRAGVP